MFCWSFRQLIVLDLLPTSNWILFEHMTFFFRIHSTMYFFKTYFLLYHSNIFFRMKISNCEIEIFYKIMSNRFDSFPYLSRRELNFFWLDVTKFDLRIFMLSTRSVDFAGFHATCTRWSGVGVSSCIRGKYERTAMCSWLSG